MNLKEQLKNLATQSSRPCLTISLNTHLTHPDNAKDEVKLKNFIKEAEDRIIAEFGKRSVASLLEKLAAVSSEIDVNYNQHSLHIFLSNETKEIIKSSWNTDNEGVHLSNSFAVRSIIKSYTRSENYLLMLLSQSGAHLYEVLNDTVVQEVINDDFPYPESSHYNKNIEKVSDSKHLDNLVREYLNKVDKALVNVYNKTELNCIVICTEDNYSRLQQVADKPSIYIGYDSIDYNNTETHQIVKQSWEIIKLQQKERRSKAISEMEEAVAHGTVLTDLQEIYQATIDGNGDLLIVHQDFEQAVVMTSNRTFKLIDDRTTPDAIDDITSNIAWEVLSKNGRVFFTSQDEIKKLGQIVLKTRY